ncbi:hypothetical protein M2125_001014 [Polynucleobacter sphagniphilus]|nr:hypothetical protein [Polynucleobacter sphagniphilus]
MINCKKLLKMKTVQMIPVNNENSKISRFGKAIETGWSKVIDDLDFLAVDTETSYLFRVWDKRGKVSLVGYVDEINEVGIINDGREKIGFSLSFIKKKMCVKFYSLELYEN